MDEVAGTGTSTPAISTGERRSPSTEPESSPKSPRSASLKAVASIARNIMDEDDDIKDDSDSDQEPKFKKRKLSPLPEEEEIAIGHHIHDSRLPVIANWRKNGAFHLRVPRQAIDTPELLELFHQHLSKNCQVQVGNVQLCPLAFEQFDCDVTLPMDRSEKMKLIIALLEAKVPKKVKGKPTNISDGADTQNYESGDAHKDSEIRVGCFTQDPSIPVYATIQYKANVDQYALCFRLEDSSHESRTQVGLDHIKLEKKFDKGSVKETRAYIKGLLHPNSSATESNEASPEPSSPASGGRTVDQTSNLGKAASKTHKAVKNCLTELIADYEKGNSHLKKAIEEHEATFHSIEEENYQLRSDLQYLQVTSAAKDNEIVRLQGELKKKDQTIAQLRVQALAEEQKVTTAQHSLEMEALQRTLAGSQDENILLRDRIQDLEALQAKNTQSSQQLNIFQKSSIMAVDKLSTTPTQMSRAKDLQYDQSIFRMIPPGRENAGMYQERFNRKVLSEGKVYEERKFLHEFTLHVNGTDMVESVEMDGVAYARYQKDGKDKFVSIVAPEFVVEHEGKMYVKRILRVEIDEDDEEQLDDAL